MSNILLIRPPSAMGSIKVVSHSHLPLNLLYFARALKDNGHHVDLLDMEVTGYDETLLTKMLKAKKYTLTGITAMTATVNSAYRIAGIIHQYSPLTVTLLGGHHADAMPLEAKKEFSNNIDIVAFGECERTIVRTAHEAGGARRWDSINGIAFEKDGTIVVNPREPLIKDLDEIPYPAYELIKFSDYKGAVSPGICSENAVEMITARGCMYRCEFCAIKNTFGQSMRFRSVPNIMGEVELLKRKGARHIYFVDSTFTANNKLTYALCAELKKTRITWNCSTRIDCITEELLFEMKKAGCVKVSYGIESGSKRIRDINGKSFSDEQIIKTFGWTKKARLISSAFFIIGADPSETPLETEMTWRLAKKIDPDFCAFSIITPYPGTGIYKKMRELGFLNKADWDGFAHYTPRITWRTEHYNGDDMVRIKERFNRSFYLRPSYLLKRALSLKNAKEIFYYMRGFFTLFAKSKKSIT